MNTNTVLTTSSLEDGKFIKATGPGEFVMRALFPGHKLAQLIIVGNLAYQTLTAAHPETTWQDWEVDADYCGTDMIKVTVGRRNNTSKA